MAQKQLNKQIEQIKSSLTKKYEDSDNPVLKIKSALSHLNISCAELDLEKLKHAVTKAKNRNLKTIKKLQSQRSSSSHSHTSSYHSHHHHTHPQHRNVSIPSNKEEESLSGDDALQLHEKRSKWRWLYLVQLICRCLTYFFIIVSIFGMIGILLAQRHKTNQSSSSTVDNSMHRTSADELTGMDTLRLLTLSVTSSLFNMFVAATPEQASDDDNMNINGEIGKISCIQSMDSSTIFVKESLDDEIHFVPFRKPLDSWCSRREFSFERDCVNVHNVRNVEFHSSHDELEFLISGSYPRLIEIGRDSVVLLNDRVFGISADGESLEERTNNEYYQNGMKFCLNNLFYESDTQRIIVSGSCYGVLYLPLSSIWDELQLLSTKWSSIIIDSNLNVNSLIIATNHEASIIFRSQLSVQSNLKVAATDNSYIEFKEIISADYISMITLEGSQLFIPSLMNCRIVDLAARNHSLIECDNIMQCSDMHLSISHFSAIKMPHIQRTQITYKRQQNTQLLLPKPYQNIHDDKDLANTLSFA